MIVVGVIMLGLGLYLAGRPLLVPGRPVTTSRWLDLAFALFFMLRGVMNIRAARRFVARGAPRPGGEPTEGPRP